MPKRIYVGNLPFGASDHEIRELFAKFGKVVDVYLPADRSSTAYVDMESGGGRAASGLDGKTFSGKRLRVSEARPRG